MAAGIVSMRYIQFVYATFAALISECGRLRGRHPIISLDMPENAEPYIHRPTGRRGITVYPRDRDNGTIAALFRAIFMEENQS
jgi:hypothetical protein